MLINVYVNIKKQKDSSVSYLILQRPLLHYHHHHQQQHHHYNLLYCHHLKLPKLPPSSFSTNDIPRGFIASIFMKYCGSNFNAFKQNIRFLNDDDVNNNDDDFVNDDNDLDDDDNNNDDTIIFS